MESCHIIHEGCTEEHYLRHLFQLMGMPSSSLKAQFHNYQGGGAFNALYKFKALVDDQGNSHIKHYLIMMDNDVPNVNTVKNQIFAYAPPGKDISFITSEPCIEGFLIAHFEANFMSNTYHKCIAKTILRGKPQCAQCIAHLTRNHIPNYSKSNCQVSFSEKITKKGIAQAHRITTTMKNIALFVEKIS